jgi:hypothetical protein
MGRGECRVRFGVEQALEPKMRVVRMLRPSSCSSERRSTCLVTPTYGQPFSSSAMYTNQTESIGEVYLWLGVALDSAPDGASLGTLASRRLRESEEACLERAPASAKREPARVERLALVVELRNRIVETATGAALPPPGTDMRERP